MKTSIYRNNNCISTQATWRSFDICVNCLAAMFSLYVHAYEVYVDIVTLWRFKKMHIFAVGGLYNISIFQCLTLRIRITGQQNLTLLSHCAWPTPVARALHVDFRYSPSVYLWQWTEYNELHRKASSLIVDG